MMTEHAFRLRRVMTRTDVVNRRATMTAAAVRLHAMPNAETIAAEMIVGRTGATIRGCRVAPSRHRATSAAPKVDPATGTRHRRAATKGPAVEMIRERRKARHGVILPSPKNCLHASTRTATGCSRRRNSSRALGSFRRRHRRVAKDARSEDVMSGQKVVLKDGRSRAAKDAPSRDAKVAQSRAARLVQNRDVTSAPKLVQRHGRNRVLRSVGPTDGGRHVLRLWDGLPTVPPVSPPGLPSAHAAQGDLRSVR